MLRFILAQSAVVAMAPLLTPGCDAGGGPDIDEPAAAPIDPDDLDGDGVRNGIDEDIDGDGVPNIEDDDIDGDNMHNAEDGTPFGENNIGGDEGCVGAQGDCDNDGRANDSDDDDDGDGIPDGVRGDGSCDGGVTAVSDENADCDGFCLEPETGFYACDDGAQAGAGVPDSDGDGVSDPFDPDDDGDDILDPDDGNDGGLDPIEPGECTNEQFTTGEDLLNPRILLVIDKSGSMEQPDSSGQRKWDAARNALSGVVQSLNDSIEFGLMLYPNGDASNDVCREGNLLQAIEAMNSNDIVATLNATEPGGGTPTAVTLAAARGILDALGNPDAGARAIILATDGGPNCNESLDGDTCRCVSPNASDCQDGGAANCLDDANAISAAAQLNASGYPVFVVGIDGTEAFTDVLDALAQAGGTAQAGASAFYGVDDQAQLQGALEDIVIRIGVCRFDLLGNLQAQQVTVSVNGNVIARDSARVSGWDQVDPNTIELFGVPCDDAVSGGAGATVVDIQVCPL